MNLRASLALGLAPALLLAACNKGDAPAGGAASVSGGPVAAVPPPAGKAWADVVETTPQGGLVMGNPKAAIKLVEYGSLSCPHCAKLAQDGAVALTEKYVNTGKVSWEFRSFAIHPQDVPLTMLVRCAPPEAQFALVEQIYANFDALNAPLMDKAVVAKAEEAGKLPPAQRFPALADALGYTDFFAARGIARDQAHACLAKPEAAQKVASESDAASQAGINQTPTVMINGAHTEGDTWAKLEPLLQQAGAR